MFAKKGFLNEKPLCICILELESTRMQINHMLEFHPDIVAHIPFDEWLADED